MTPVQYLHLPGGNTRGRGIERNTETLAQADVYMSYFKTNTITHSDDKTETKETESHEGRICIVKIRGMPRVAPSTILEEAP